MRTTRSRKPGPDYTAGCPACSAIADGFDGFVVHLANQLRGYLRARWEQPSPCVNFTAERLNAFVRCGGSKHPQSLAESAKGETGVVNGLHSNIGLLVETHHALRGVAGSARETAGVQAADGVELPLGVVVRQ